MIGLLALPPLETTSLGAQIPDTAKKPTPADSARVDTAIARARRQVLSEAHQIKLHEVMLAVGGVAVLTLIDETVHEEVQEHRTQALGDLAEIFRQEGEPVYYIGVSVGILGFGVITGNADVKRAGGRVAASVIMSAVVMEGMKMLVGRSRPNERVGAFIFHPFTTLKDSAGIEARGSMPSGHTTAAFAVATSLADDIDNLPVEIGLYALATGTGFSRVYQSRHWFSDTVAGAILGITTARLVSGRWRIFNLKPPGFLVTPTGTPALGWSIPVSTSPRQLPLSAMGSVVTR